MVDTKQRFLYLVQPGGKAIRYGVGLGKDGFAWSGRGVIQWKAKWPRWTPPQDMVERQPELPQFARAEGGALPGLNNPLGARALYIYRDGKDTLLPLCMARQTGNPSARQPRPAVCACSIRM